MIFLGNYLTFSIPLTNFMNMENVIWPFWPNEKFGTLHIHHHQQDTKCVGSIPKAPHAIFSRTFPKCLFMIFAVVFLHQSFSTVDIMQMSSCPSIFCIAGCRMRDVRFPQIISWLSNVLNFSLVTMAKSHFPYSWNLSNGC